MKNLSSQKLSEEHKKFENLLETKGLKLSKRREEVFHEVFHAHGHFTAEGLVKVCRQKKRKASRATIYRALHELLEARVIRETAFGEKHQCFEHIYDEKPHHHARCVRCHNVIEFPDLEEDERYHPILGKKGFHILGHEMHFYGICKNCLR